MGRGGEDMGDMVGIIEDGGVFICVGVGRLLGGCNW